MKTSKISDLEKLSYLLKEKAEKVCNEALQTNKQPQPSQIEELKALEELIEIINKTNKTSIPPSHWPVITLLFVTLAIVSILLFARISSTEINMDVSVSDAAFRLSQRQLISKTINLSSLGVSGLKQIQFPGIDTGGNKIPGLEDASVNAIKLEKDTNSKSEGSLTLSPLMLQSKAIVWIQPVFQGPGFLNLLVRDSQLVLKADVLGTIKTGQPGIPPRQLSFHIPKSFILQSGSNDVDITIKPLNDEENIFNEQIFIDSLSFFHVDEYTDNQNTVLQQVSGVRSGKLYFESLGESEHTLHPSEEIRFKKLNGSITNIKLQNNQISFTFRGLAGGISTGGKEDRISLMPTYLEWLKARHSLTLLWGTTVYFFGLFLGIKSWWKTTT